MMTFWSFLLQWLVAVLVLTLVIYLPGRFLLRWLRLDLNALERLTAAMVAGTGLLVLFYWGLSWLQVQFLLWAYLVLVGGAEVFFTLQDRKKIASIIPDPDKPLPETLTSHWPIWLLVFGGMVAQGRFTLFTGWHGAEGLNLLAWHGHDAPWHIFNLWQLASRFPPEMPGFAGALLQNYHMFSDLLWGAVLHLVSLDPWHVYFRIAPLFYSGLLTLTTFVAARAWSGKVGAAYLAAAMTLFCSNFGYLLPLFFGSEKYFLWDAIFWVQPPLTNIFNPGVSSSFALVMAGLWALTRWLRGKDWNFVFLVALFWGVLPGFKVYPGLLMLLGLLGLGIVRAVWHRDYKPAVAWAALLPIFLLVFLPSTQQAAGLVKFLPGFNLGSMLVAPDRMALMTSEALKLMFAARPGMVVLLMAGLALVFLIGNLGVRVLGLIPMIRALCKPREADPLLLFMVLVVAGAWAAPLLFVQQGVQWNTIQFFYYAVLLTALPAADQFWSWIHRLKPRWKYGLVAVLFALGLPAAVQAWMVINFREDIPPAATEAFRWLRQHAGPEEMILRPLPQALMTDDGYEQWLRNQTRGEMTSLKVWRAEAEALASGQDAVGPSDEAPDLAVEPETPAETPEATLSRLQGEVELANKTEARARRKVKQLTQDRARVRREAGSIREAKKIALEQIKSLERELTSLEQPEEILEALPEASPESAVAPEAETGAASAGEPEIPEAETVIEAGGDTVASAAEPRVEARSGSPAAIADTEAERLVKRRALAEAVQKAEQLAKDERQTKAQLNALKVKLEQARQTEQKHWEELQRREQMLKKFLTTQPEAGKHESAAAEESGETGVEGNGALAQATETGNQTTTWPDSALVAGVALKNTYLEDTVSAQIMGYPVKARVRAARTFFREANVVEARDFLEKESITYVILYKTQALPFEAAGVPLKIVFENEKVLIYKYIFPGGW